MRKETVDMKVADMRPFRKVLEQLRSRLRGDVSTMADAALGTGGNQDQGVSSTQPVHMDDLSSEAFDQEFTLSLMENEEDTLQMIDEALARIRHKTFGTCIECNGIITKKRLEALPYAPTCIRCAEKLEQKRW
jgi:RNA polymerase-binding transcription factor DksA